MATSSKTQVTVDAVSSTELATKTKKPLIDRILKQLSSVRFGITLLVILIVMCMIGMLIMQVNIEGFDKYFASLTPAKQAVYSDPILRFIRETTGWRLDGWNILNFSDIYRSYVFIGLVALLSLNIILASIDRFPSAWRFVRHKKLSASKTYALTQPFHATLKSTNREDEAELIAELCRQYKLKPTITREEKRTTVFAERGAWNRLGAYAVHVALLTIFTSGFVHWRTGYVGSMTLTPGATADTMQMLEFELDKPKVTQFKLPFVVECTDIQQTLLDPKGDLGSQNTVDWFTRIRIKDNGAVTAEAPVHMNKPFDYEGYRFFQSSYQMTGNARSIVLEVQRPDSAPEEVTIKKNESARLADGTEIRFTEFGGDLRFSNGRIEPVSTEYRNPGAGLQVTAADGTKSERVIAFTPSFLAATAEARPKATFGDKVFTLKDFEKVGGSHTLSVQYDPSANIFYLGSVLLIGTLIAVFFFSHSRVWFVLEEDATGERRLYAGGNTNRNRIAFEQKFNGLVAAIDPSAQPTQVTR